MEKIVFDLIGVITEESYFASKVLYPLIKDHLSYDRFKKRYLLYCIGNITNDEFWEDVIPEKKIAKFEDVLFDKFVKYNKPLINFIKRLNKDGRHLYLASEIPQRWGDLILKSVGLDSCFKKKFYSSKIGHTKPFLGFFGKIFASRDFVGKKIIYIDDTGENLVAIRKYKFPVKTILYAKNNSGYRCDFKVKNIVELEKIIYG